MTDKRIDQTVTIAAEPMGRIARQIFEACGAPEAEASIVADHLITSSLMGFDSHGVMRIPQYVNNVIEQVTQPGAPITVHNEGATTATIDCGMNFGQVGATRATEVAMGKASRANISAVVTRRCGHVGRLGAYTEMAARRGFIALAACNSGSKGRFVLPWGGREGRFATNPISFAFPCPPDDPIVADFSTAAVPEGVIRMYLNREAVLPEKIIVDAQGRQSNDPKDFYGPPRGAILPFGGSKGYRGYALALLVEFLAGVLGGVPVSSEHDGNGVGIIVMRTSAFLPRERYAELAQELRTYVKSSPPEDPEGEVFLPGEIDFKTKARRLQNGLPINTRIWDDIRAAGSRVGVDCSMASRRDGAIHG